LEERGGGMISTGMEAAKVMLYHPAWQWLLSNESTLYAGI
jgi:hypothetical protein